MSWLDILKGRKEHPKTSYGERKKTKTPTGNLRTGNVKIDKPVHNPSKYMGEEFMPLPKDVKDFMDLDKPTEEEIQNIKDYDKAIYDKWLKTLTTCPCCDGTGKVSGDEYEGIMDEWRYS
jgi:hypothetical protein